MILVPFVIRVPAAGPDWTARWTAIGTVALAAVTVVAIVTTIIIAIQDRRRADNQEQYAEASRSGSFRPREMLDHPLTRCTKSPVAH